MTRETDQVITDSVVFTAFTENSLTNVYINEKSREDSESLIAQSFDWTASVSDDEDDDDSRSTAGGEEESNNDNKDDEKDEIIPADALRAISNEGTKLLSDMWSAAMVFPPSFDTCLYNMDDNRVPHLICYDHNRVILKDKFGTSSYYHASFVDGYAGKSSYIFAQAPFNKNTEHNFWRMVNQEKPQIIIVFGAIDEKQKRDDDEKYDISRKNFQKAFCSDFSANEFDEAEKKVHINRFFWPLAMSNQNDYGKNDVINVTNCGIYKDRHIDVYSLTVGEARTKPGATIIVHFKDWMDDDPLPEFLCDMRAAIKIHITRNSKKQSAFVGPIMLVCPTGVARCGIYATIDIVLHRLTEEHTVGIKETMAAIKAQRYGCFKNLDHYKMVREMIMRFAVASGVVHDTAIGDKPESVRKPKKVSTKPKKKKLFSGAAKKKLGK